MRIGRPRSLFPSLALAVVTLSQEALGGGFYLTDRGVRPLGRGGAFVAGADDLHATWYNPAGLVEAGRGVLLDASLVLFGNTYTRTLQVDPSLPTVGYRAVDGAGAPLPVPTVVVAHNFGLRDFMFAVGVMAPYAAITTYDQRPDAPQRYSLFTLDGSLLSVLGAWAAWRPSEAVAVGGGFMLLSGSFVSRLALTACPATITCAPEDPDWDAIAHLQVGPILAPTGNLGVKLQPHRLVALGASVQLPIPVRAPATLGVRLPGASFYDGAQVVGQDADVAFDLAPVVRLGVELRPLPRTRIELAGVWEGWSVHDQIALQPRGIRIENARGVGTYEVGPVSLARGFQDSFSVRLGAETETALGRDWSFMARVGAAYESSATPLGYTSVLTMDSDKFVGSLGASFRRGRLRMDLVFAHMFASSVEVSTANARLYATAPFRAGPGAPRYPINAGRYDLSVEVFGMGMQYSF